MIEVKELSKSYGEQRAVEAVSFKVDKGEILGLLGPNGAGKSTTMNMITGYISMSSGAVLVNGVDVLEKPIEAKKMIGYLPEQPPLYMDMTVGEYLSFVYDLKGVKMNISKKDHIADVMNTVSIADVKKRKIKNLSKGYRQRVGFAQALIGKPEVLILDEPTVGLDPNQIVEIRDVIRTLKRDHTIIFSTHILSEVSELCDRVVIINKGRIAASGTPEELGKYTRSTHIVTLKVNSCGDDFKEEISRIDSVAGIRQDENMFVINARDDIMSEISRLCFDKGVIITELKSDVPTLEKLFLELTMTGGAADEGNI